MNMQMIKFNKKGISTATAVLLVTISITLVGTTYFFSSEIMRGTMAETFEVIDIFSNRVIVRNTGTEPIEELKTLVDGIEVENDIEVNGVKNIPIHPGKVGTIVIEGITTGRHELVLISESMSQKWVWVVEEVPVTTVMPGVTTIATTTSTTTTVPGEFGGNSVEAYVPETEQGTAEIGKPVKWTSKIDLSNPTPMDIINYKARVFLPEDARNIVIKDTERKVQAENKKFWTVSVAGKDNTSYFVEFETPAPYKEESMLVIEGWGKTIKVKSNASLHYKNVSVNSKLSEDAVNFRLYLVENNVRIDVTDNPSYNVSFVDTDGNDIADRIDWIVPELSEIIFETQGETPWLNVTLLTPDPFLYNETYPCDWDQDSEQWINASVECKDGDCGDVSALVMYNDSSSTMIEIPTSETDPFYIIYPITGDPDNDWYNVTPDSPYTPPARSKAAMAYDSNHDRTILFGGSPKATGGQQNDTWIFNYTDLKWYNVTSAMPIDERPPSRYKHVMAYDSKNDRTILFGGDNIKGVEQNDTWIFNYTDFKWYNITPDGSPPPRFYPTMVYDSGNDATILFGGIYGSTMLNDTWVLNYSDENGWEWYNITPDKSPPVREWHAMAYDSESKGTIMFGGYYLDGNIYYNDTWVLNYSDEIGWKWYNVSNANNPGERYGHAMVYDSESKKTVLFGGYRSPNRYYDTWVFNYTDLKWYEMNPTNHPDTLGRYWHSMAYDSKHDRTIIYGGFHDTINVPNMSDTWVYNYTYGGAGNPLSCSLLQDESCQLNWTVQVIGDADSKWKIDVEFSSSQVSDNVTGNATVNILGPDVEEPRYWDNSTNSTIAGEPVGFRLDWTDDRGLDGFVFSWFNGAYWIQTNETSDQESETKQFQASYTPASVTVLHDTSFESENDATEGYQDDAANNWDYLEDSPRTDLHGPHVDGSATNAKYTYSSSHDISGYSWCNIDVYFKIETGWDNNEYICLDYSTDDGSSWNQDDSHSSSLCVAQNYATDDDVYHKISYNETDTSDDTGFKWRFRSTVSGSAEDGWVDDINVTCGVLEVLDTEANKTYTEYDNVLSGDLYEVITNITVTVNVSTYDNSGSSNNGNSDPDLWLEIFDGNDWTEIGNMSITGTGNFSNSTQDTTILSAWSNPDNRDIRIKGRYLDNYDTSNFDEINYTDLWIQIDSNQEFLNDTWQQFPNTPTKSDWSNVTKVVNSTVDATIKWIIYANDTTDNWNASDIFSFVTIPGIDLDPPEWSNNQTNITSAYSSTTKSFFNITWTDVSGVDNVFIEGNWSGIDKNYTMFKYSGTDVYGYNLTLPVGDFYWRSYANDTSDNEGISDTWFFTVVKGSTETRLYLNNSEGDKSYNKSDIAFITATTDISSLIVSIYANYTGSLKLINSSFGTTYNYTDISNLDFGPYLIKANTTVNDNYTSSEVSYILTVVSGWLNVTLLIPDPSVCKETDPCDWLQNNTYSINATIECKNGPCGDVEGLARYNDTAISTTEGDKPFYVTTTNPKSCGTLNGGDTCQLNWTINATGDPEDIYEIDVNFTSSYDIWNDTDSAFVEIITNKPPEIWNLYVRDLYGDSITETGTGVKVNITVNVSDDNLDYVEGEFTFPNGTSVYKNLTYYPNDKYMYNWTYTISFDVPNGTAKINVTAYDELGAWNDMNTTLEIWNTIEFVFENDPINFSIAVPGQIRDALPDQGWPLLAVIQGNTLTNLSQSAEEHLKGIIYPTENIGIRNITWNTNTSESFTELSDSALIVNDSVQPGYSQPIYYRLNVPTVKNQTYGGIVNITARSAG